MSDDNPENLPEAQTHTIDLDLPRPVQIDDTLKSIQEIDLAHTNNLLELMYAYIPQIKSISSLCKMSDSILNIVEKRRKQLCLPYGAESKNSSTRVLEPDD